MIYLPKIIRNQKGFGLMIAIFVIVIMGTFGTLIAQYTAISFTESSEEYLWGQALYSAESAAQLRILTHDGGGSGGWNGTPGSLTIEQFDITAPIDTFTVSTTSATLAVQATRVNVTRKIEINFLLSDS